MIKIKEITLTNLHEAFALAQEGFNLNKKKSERIFDYIYNSNLSINFFGYSLYSNKRLAGVLFTPIQGYIQNKPGVNLTLFYVIPSSRGLKTIQFFDKSTKLMKEKFSFINSYTATKSVFTISRKLGYKSMKMIYVIPKPFNVLRLLLSYPFKKLRGLQSFQIKKEIFIPNFKSIDFCKTKNICSFIYKNKLNNIDVKFSGYFARRKKLFRYFHIIYSSNDSSLNLVLPEIQIHFLLRYRIFILANISLLDLDLHQNNYILKPYQNYFSTYLILSNQENLDYIPALASEVPMLFS